jgi:PAT family acetyl-CoA transporter-like MFS transporter 1
VILLVFESKEFCNKYIYSEPKDRGLLTLAGFLNFWAFVFLATTVLVAIFKKERAEGEDLENHADYGIRRAYPILWKIVKLKPIMKFSLILLTVKASFAAVDVVTTLKFVEYGVPKDKIALLAIPLVPLQLVLPFIISRFTAGPKPMIFYIKAFPFRLIMTVVIVIFVYFTPKMMIDNEFPFYFYVAIICIYMVYQVRKNSFSKGKNFFKKYLKFFLKFLP